MVESISGTKKIDFSIGSSVTKSDSDDSIDIALQRRSSSIWNTLNWPQRLLFCIKVPLRALMCMTNIIVFFITYFGFMLPIMWALSAWPRLYWYCEGKLYHCLQGFIGYWGYTAGYDVYEFGDDLTEYCENERVLVIVNHQSTADVPTLMAILQGKGVVGRKTLWLMDIMFKWTPFGIIGRMHGDYFIQQGKSTRDSEIVRLKKHMQKVFWDRDRRWIILFPEGGFYYNRVESSQKYAREHGFPHLKYTTLPRMGAVKAILDEIGPRNEDSGSSEEEQRLRKKNSSVKQLLKDTVGAIREKKYIKDTKPPIKWVLDVTIAYANGHPLGLDTLAFGTRQKCDIAVNYKMFNAAYVPFDDEDQLRDWMYARYVEKDEILANFYRCGQFKKGEQGTRVYFPWSVIIGQYTFWFVGFFVQYKAYSWLLMQVWHFLSYVWSPR